MSMYKCISKCKCELQKLKQLILLLNAQWPSATPLHQKLYGRLEDLKKTTNFITAAGLVV